MALPTDLLNYYLPTDGPGRVKLGPFVSSNGDVYVVGVHYDISDGYNVGVWKATDPTSSFSLADKTPYVTISQNQFAAVAATFHNDTIYIAYQWNASAVAPGRVTFREFDCSTDSMGTSSVLSTPTDVPEFHGVDITVRSDGDVVVVYHGENPSLKGGTYQEIAYSRREGSTWTNGTVVATSGQKSLHYFYPKIGIAPSTDEVAIISKYDLGNTWYAFLYTISSNNTVNYDGLFSSAQSNTSEYITDVSVYERSSTAYVRAILFLGTSIYRALSNTGNTATLETSDSIRAQTLSVDYDDTNHPNYGLDQNTNIDLISDGGTNGSITSAATNIQSGSVATPQFANIITRGTSVKIAWLDASNRYDEYEIRTTGPAGRTGIATFTLGDVTLSSDAELPIDGSVTATLAAVTVDGVAELPIEGTASFTLDTVTLDASGGAPPITATADFTLQDFVEPALSATVLVSGSASFTLADLPDPQLYADVLISSSTGVTLADLTSSASAELPIDGSSAFTLDAVTVASAVSTGDPLRLLISWAEVEYTEAVSNADAAFTLDPVTTDSASTLLVSGSTSITLADLTGDSTAELPIAGSSTVTLDALTLDAVADTQAAATATAAITLDEATADSAAEVTVSGSTDYTLEAVSAASAGELLISGSLNASAEAATISSDAAVDIAGSGDVTLDDVSVSATGGAPEVFITGQADLADLTLTAETDVWVSGDSSVSLDPATVSATTDVVASVSAGISLESLDLVADAVTKNRATVDVTLGALTTSSMGETLNESRLRIYWLEFEVGSLGLEGVSNLQLSDVTLSADGAVDLIGSATITLADLTTTSDVDVEIVADSSITLDVATLEATTQAIAGASLDATFEDLTATSEAVLPIDATLSATLADVTVSASTSNEFIISTSLQIGDATVEASGDVEIVGSLSQSLDPATFDISGILPLGAQSSISLDPVSIAGSADAIAGASLSKTLDDVTLTSLVGNFIVISQEFTLEDLTVSATAELPIAGSFDSSLADLTTNAAGTVDIVGSSGFTLDTLTLTTDVDLIAEASADLTLDELTVSGVIVQSLDANAAFQLDTLTVSSTGSVPVGVSLGATLGEATLEADTQVIVSGALSGSLSGATVDSEGTVETVIHGTLDATLEAAGLTSTANVDIAGYAGILLGDLQSAAAANVIVSAESSITLGSISLYVRSNIGPPALSVRPGHILNVRGHVRTANYSGTPRTTRFTGKARMR